AKLHPIRRAVAIMATLVGALLAFGAAAPAAYASLPPHGGGPAPAPGRLWPIVVGGMPVPAYPRAPARAPAQVHTIVSGGMPGWQIPLIAAAAALAAATLAVMVDRARATRRRLTAPAA